jgi:hypothetical protein
MAQLPVPGNDGGTRGGVQNSFLTVSHASDGSLLTSTIRTAGGATMVTILT